MKRRNFLAAACASGLAFPAILRASNQPTMKFGIVADPQYADIEAKGTRYYRQSIGKLTDAIEEFNRHPLAWCVNLGDFIDQKWASFDTIFQPLTQSKHRFHHVLGNHDFDLEDRQKASVPSRLAMPQRYYAIEFENWKFLFLDTTDISLYAHPAKTSEQESANEELKRYTSQGKENAKAWNGAVSDTQLRWLDNECQSASKAGKRVILFAHHPVYPASPHTEWNSDRILAVIRSNRNVVAWFNGHNHAGAFGVDDDVPFVTHHGMVETESTNAYSVVELYADRLVLTGHGRERSRELVFRQV